MLFEEFTISAGRTCKRLRSPSVPQRSGKHTCFPLALFCFQSVTDFLTHKLSQ